MAGLYPSLHRNGLHSATLSFTHRTAPSPKGTRPARWPVFTTLSLLITALIAVAVISNTLRPPDGFGMLAQRPITIALLAVGMVINGVLGIVGSSRAEGERL